MAFLGSLRVAVYSPLPTKVKRKLPFHLGGGGEGTEGTADASAFPTDNRWTMRKCKIQVTFQRLTEREGRTRTVYIKANYFFDGNRRDTSLKLTLLVL